MFLILLKNESPYVLLSLISYLISIWNGVTIGSESEYGRFGIRFIEPLGRSSLWRLDPSRFPVNENDDHLNCGGFERRWIQNKGQCGICGDPADGPREHEIGGKFYSGHISKSFSQNTVIDVAIETKSVFKGYVEFKICDYSGSSPVTQDCLNNHVLKIGGTNHSRYRILNQGYHVIPLQLPEKLYCKECLLQLKYHIESRWGCHGDECCFGCGKQEEFYNCADITIGSEFTLKYKSADAESYIKWWCTFQCLDNKCQLNVCSRFSHLRKKRQTATNCKGTGVWENNAAMDTWCQLNCASYCPDLYCKCTGGFETLSTPTTTTTTTPSTTPGLLNIFVTPSQATAVYGVSSYQIRCYVTGAPGATNWYWTKTPLNGGPPITLSRTTDNAHYKIEQSATQPHLTIFGITEADEADYVCYAGNGAGLRSSTTSRLEVTGGLLSVSVSPSEYTATVGESSLTIECTISGEPEAVTWYWKKSPLDGTPSTIISRGVNNQIHQVAESTTNPHLTIKNIVKDDAADYECYAVNIAGTSSSNAKVRIYVKDYVPAVVRLLASSGCQYCNSRNNVTCADWYCSEEYLASLSFSGSVTEKMNMLADDFCSICNSNDSSCQNYFCLPNREIVSLTVQARCNLCQSQAAIDCPTTIECSSFSSPPLKSEPGVLKVQQVVEVTCRGVRPIYNSEAMDEWCKTVCSYGFCPQNMCECGYFSGTTSTMSTTTTTITTLSTSTSPQPVADPYSMNVMNRVMCSICSQSDVNSACSIKYCDVYYSHLDDPSNRFDRVLSYSPELFCDLATNDGNERMQNLYCGRTHAAFLTDLKTLLCNTCQNTHAGNQCDSYCS